MNQKTINKLCKINKVIDENFEKLSDKLHNLELSHNRKCTLLLQLEKKLKFLNKYCIQENWIKDEIEDVLFKINGELICCGRIRERWGK